MRKAEHKIRPLSQPALKDYLERFRVALLWDPIRAEQRAAIPSP